MNHSLIELIQQYRFGSQEEAKRAIAIVLEEKSDSLYGKCLRILGNEKDAEDCLQEIKFFFINRSPDKREKDFREATTIGPIVTFLLRTANNRALNYLREQKRRNLNVPLDLHNLDIPNHDDDLILEYKDVLQPAMNNLQRDIREFTLAWLRNPKEKQKIMADLNISENQYEYTYKKMKFDLKREIIKLQNQ